MCRSMGMLMQVHIRSLPSLALVDHTRHCVWLDHQINLSKAPVSDCHPNTPTLLSEVLVLDTISPLPPVEREYHARLLYSTARLTKIRIRAFLDHLCLFDLLMIPLQHVNSLSQFYFLFEYECMHLVCSMFIHLHLC